MLSTVWAIIGHYFLRLSGGHNHRKQIVMFAHSSIMVDYLLRYANAITSLRKKEVCIHIVLFAMSSDAKHKQAARCKKVGLNVMAWWRAPWRVWDLCVVADHSFPQELLLDGVPVLFIYHGMSSGKIIRGENYKYGRPYVYDDYGRLKYDVIFEAGTYQAEAVAQNYPYLAHAIRVVGEPSVDLFLDLCSKANKTRAEFGFTEADRVVMIQSTWGSESLEQKYGKDLFKVCHEIAEQEGYYFVFSTHPNHWGDNPQIENRSEYYLAQERPRFKVLRPGDDRSSFLSISDICVSDITSLSLLYAFAMRPLVFIPDLDVVPESELAQLINACPRLEKIENLPHLLKQLPACYPYDDIKKLLSTFCESPGNASTLMTRETATLLGLEHKY